MTGINEFHASHIGKVRVNFFLYARDLDPDVLSKAFGLNPDAIAKRGDERRNYNGDLLSPHEQGFWMISSERRVESKDINDHISSLLILLLPRLQTFLQNIDELQGETYFDVLWTSNYLYAGTGPLISREMLRGMSDLGASIGFDIYADDDSQ